MTAQQIPTIADWRVLDHRALSLDPADLGHDVDAADEYAELYFHDGPLITTTGFDGRDPDNIRAVAEWWDRLATVAQELADELRHQANSVCDDCSGTGLVGHDDRDCKACAGTGVFA